MNRHLQKILDFIEQNEKLTAEEKALLIKAAKDTDSDLTISEFKLERTEKVKRTTATLLEETIQELEQKRKAVEAQNRELEIETSLERVRTVAMSMMKPDDLLNVCKIQFSELKQLGFNEIRNALINTFDDDKAFFLDYDYSDFMGGAITKIPLDAHPIIENHIKRIKGGSDAFSEAIVPESELKDWIESRRKRGEPDDPRLENIKILYYYFYSVGSGAIGISTYQQINHEQLIILKRFRNVFDLAYRRYIDITLAEEQAKEARIEASLERMRAAAMSMRTSAELINVSEAMYKELTSLGFSNIRNAQISIRNLVNESYFVSEYSDHVRIAMGEAPYDSSPLVREIYSEMERSNDAFYQKEFTGKEFEDWRKWRTGIDAAQDPRIKAATSMCFYLYSIGKGYLGISTFNKISNDQVEILKRFKKVFELSYQRYTDVAKAEEQARESQIELALERVRARTMAMQKSDELAETSLVLFQQLKELGEPADQLSIGIVNESENIVEVTVTLHGEPLRNVFRHSIDEPILMNKIYKSWKSQQKTLIVEIKGKELETYNKYRNELIGTKVFTQHQYRDDRRVVHSAFFSKGMLALATNEPRPKESLQLLERFASVFDLTYTRFLDLQRVEAQAREAQIELGLERVRAKAMAMRTSDELNGLISTVFTELTKLDLVLTRCVLMIYDAVALDSKWWMANSEEPDKPMGFHIKNHDHPPIAAYFKAWNERQFKWTYALEGKIKKDWDGFLFSETELMLLPDFVITGMKAPEKVYLNASFNNFGNLTLATLEPLSQEHFDILLRFATVFEQTYTRFLDLQKAEAQARESQIQLALERVRARTMAMQHSNELAETATVLFEQLDTLGEEPERVAIEIVNEKENVFEIWATQHGGSQLGLLLKCSLDEPHVMQKMYRAWKEQKKSITIDLKGKELEEYFQYLKNTGLPVQREVFGERRVQNVATFSKGILTIITHEPRPQETIDILEKFAAVFDGTYTRFLDLQKAEAQSKEAQIELSLERVRSKTMAMHNSQDVGETVILMFDELLKLGVDTFRCGIGIMHGTDNMELWTAKHSADSTGGKVELLMGSINMNLHPLLQGAYKGWISKEETYSYELKDDDLVNYFTAINNHPDYSAKYDISSLPQRVFHNDFYFPEGSLFVFSLSQLTEDKRKIFKRFAGVFGQTYRRYLDLQKAEAQVRESQIEAALEKVRSRSLAMHTSEELQEVVNIVFERLKDLDVEISSASVIVFPENSNDMEFWVAVPGQNYSSCMRAPYFDHTVISRDFTKARASGKNFVKSYTDKEKNEQWNYLFELPDFRKIPEERRKFLLETKAYTVSVAFTKNTALQLLRYHGQVFTEKENEILQRFANVFEQAYIRFLDLKKAEAQAKEAQVEAALEKVRSRTMGMQRSTELSETAVLLFHQLNLLGLELKGCGFNIWEKDEKTCTAWMSGPDGSLTPPFNLPLTEDPFFIRYYESRQKGEDFWVHETSKEELITRFEYLRTLPVIGQLMTKESVDGIVLPSFLVDHFVNFSNGNLVFVTYKHCPEAWDIFKRFGKVFEQTYTRFLDLQKAEAQAREATIEASLERVRSKAMAMHSSENLAQTIGVFYRELESLHITPRRCGVGLLNKETKIVELSTMNTTAEGQSVELIGKLKMEDHPVLEGIYASWIVQKEYRPVLRGNEIKGYYKLIRPQISYPDYPNDAVQYGYFFFFSEGGVFAWTEKEMNEDELQIYRRFTSVLSLTYKRYKDLKQAEGNARESQIEAALERVRYKAMAMQSSEDVGAATAVVFNEMSLLGIETIRCGISVIHMDKTAEVWAASTTNEGKTMKGVGSINLLDHPLWMGMYNSWYNKEESFSYHLKGDDQKAYYKALVNSPGYSAPYLTEELPEHYFHANYFEDGAVFAFSMKAYNEDDQKIFKKFTAVFSLTFRRYQDLKNAEAQAREATIEAALEKVRGGAMAMHNSNDLSTTASMVFTELRKLGINPIRCGVGLLNKESRKGQLYSATSSTTGNSLSLVGWVELSGHPVLEMIYSSWEHDEEYYPELAGPQLKSYYDQLLKGLSVPVPDSKDDQTQYGHFIPASIGYLYAWSTVRYNDTEIKILKRFATIIDLTFRRYIELQKTEAGAREVVKQAALDRIRADIASMRTVNDLERITPLIWNELTILGIPFIRCGVFIMDDSQKLIHTFLSTPEGKAIAAFHIPYDTPGNIRKVVSSWSESKRYMDHWDKSSFTEFADILVKQGALTSPEQYLKTIPAEGFYLHFLPFLQGMLYVGNTRQLTEEEIKLIQSVADAFSTAYARYEDFNRLEAAKQQVDKTLVDLKQTQQQLVQSEKMASLGELTAGIAHEIQNPLNFVNNFSEVSKELLDEMKMELDNGNADEAIQLANDVIQNLEKINHHGKRADGIVKGMLQHSRSSSATKEPTDINKLADEYLRLAYHGLRAKDKSFNSAFKTEFDDTVGKISIIPQDIGRVVLNLLTNAFYVVNEKKHQQKNGYEPTVTISTKRKDDKVEIRVGDNGNGIPRKVLDKIFQPFFTTKPTGQGTGLGLSLSYDIITKGHGGELKVETKEGEGSVFIICLPAKDI